MKSLLLIGSLTMLLLFSSVWTTTQTATYYNNNCIGCITSNYEYCSDFSTCLDPTQTCPKGN